MSRVLKRPMFKMGGSTNEGITSGLKRTGYDEGKRVTTQDILRDYGPPPRSSNVYDFLIDFGLNIASMPPQGNIISTAAAAAREPFSKFTEGKSKGEQLAYAMRAQAADTARRQNLAFDEMEMKKQIAKDKIESAEKIAEMNVNATGKDDFLKLDNRPGFIMDQAKLFSESRNNLERTHPQGMAEWEAIKLYDKVDVQLAPIVETKGVYALDDSKFTEKDVNKIYWDPIEREYFTIKFDAAGLVQKDQRMEASYGDPENDYMDSNLQELNSILQNKQSAEIIQSGGDETDENDLTKMVVENKLEEGVVHPTIDGTRDGEISDEYVLAYAKKNKLPLLNKPDGSPDDDYRGMGGSKYWSKIPQNFIALKNSMKNDNKPSMFKDTKRKANERRKNQAFKYFNKKKGDKTFYELIQEGKLTMSNYHAPYLKEYEESLKTIVAEKS